MKPIEISFSQAATFNRCRRSWAFDKVDKIRGIPNMTAVRGTRFHKAIEENLNSLGPDDPFVQRAWSIVHDFDDYEAEAYLEYIEDDYKIRGYADVVAQNGYCNSEGKLEIYDRTVIDWKFPGKHPGKTAKKEHKDQLSLYGYMVDPDDPKDLMVAFPEYDTAFKFDYDHKRGRKVVDDILATAQEIDETAAYETPGLETEPTGNFLCQSYCSYRAICPLGGLYE